MALVQRQYKFYGQYVNRQGGKRHLVAKFQKHALWFAKYFRAAAPHLRRGRVLCLGARTGAEIQGAILAGFVGSRGIDLQPLKTDFPPLIAGDWHNIPFQAHEFDNAYSNSLDHCYSLTQMCAEIRRVLVPGGRFYVMATNRHNHTVEEFLRGMPHEALYWDDVKDLQNGIVATGFSVVAEWQYRKWVHTVFEVQ